MPLITLQSPLTWAFLKQEILISRDTKVRYTFLSKILQISSIKKLIINMEYLRHYFDNVVFAAVVNNLIAIGR